MYYIMYQKYNTPVRHLGEQRKDGCSRRRNTGELADLWRWIGGLGALSRDGSALPPGLLGAICQLAAEPAVAFLQNRLKLLRRALSGGPTQELYARLDGEARQIEAALRKAGPVEGA